MVEAKTWERCNSLKQIVLKKNPSPHYFIPSPLFKVVLKRGLFSLIKSVINIQKEIKLILNSNAPSTCWSSENLPRYENVSNLITGLTWVSIVLYICFIQRFEARRLENQNPNIIRSTQLGQGSFGVVVKCVGPDNFVFVKKKVNTFIPVIMKH